VTQAEVTPHDPYEEERPKPTISCSRSDYPDIKYWTKEEWNKAQSAKKNSSDPADQPVLKEDQDVHKEKTFPLNISNNPMEPQSVVGRRRISEHMQGQSGLTSTKET